MCPGLDSRLMHCDALLEDGARAGSCGVTSGAFFHPTCSGKKPSDLLPLAGKEHPWSSGYDVSLPLWRPPARTWLGVFSCPRGVAWLAADDLWCVSDHGALAGSGALAWGGWGDLQNLPPHEPVTCSGKKNFTLLPLGGREHQWSIGYDNSLACWRLPALPQQLPHARAGTCGTGGGLIPRWCMTRLLAWSICRAPAQLLALARKCLTCYHLKAKSTNGLLAMMSA